jgi:hypothetical protein
MSRSRGNETGAYYDSYGYFGGRHGAPSKERKSSFAWHCSFLDGVSRFYRNVVP